jgi:hypothetical protein
VRHAPRPARAVVAAPLSLGGGEEEWAAPTPSQQLVLDSGTSLVLMPPARWQVLYSFSLGWIIIRTG